MRLGDESSKKESLQYIRRYLLTAITRVHTCRAASSMPAMTGIQDNQGVLALQYLTPICIRYACRLPRRVGVHGCDVAA